MRVVLCCPYCNKQVNQHSKTCPHCAAKLTKAKFKFTHVILFGILGVLLAFVLSLIIVPLAIIGMIVAMFARDQLHQTNFAAPDSDGGSAAAPSGKGRVVDIPSKD